MSEDMVNKIVRDVEKTLYENSYVTDEFTPYAVFHINGSDVNKMLDRVRTIARRIDDEESYT